jgi:RNA polymerase sigma-70 factor (ECF subfamily)
MLDPLAAARLVRQEWSRVVAVAMRILGDLDEAEDMAQEALLEATRRWPVDGVPANPGAWLTTVARNRALNRRRDQRRRGGPPLPLDERVLSTATGEAADHADPDGFGDDRLRLVVLCCHPSLQRDAQVALTLRLVGGLTVREIANAFVQRESMVAQRISRAKRRLQDQRARFELPPVAELPARLGAVLEVVYLVFNEGYGPHSSDQRRRSLCREASMLADQLTEIAPTVPEVWGLAALLHLQSPPTARRSRSTSRTGDVGTVNRSAWASDAWPPATTPPGPAGASGPTSCRPRSPPGTPARRRSPTPTGTPSSSCTRRWWRSPTTRSSG